MFVNEESNLTQDFVIVFPLSLKSLVQLTKQKEWGLYFKIFLSVLYHNSRKKQERCRRFFFLLYRKTSDYTAENKFLMAKLRYYT